MAEDTSGAATAVASTAGAEARQPPVLDEAGGRSAAAAPAEAAALDAATAQEPAGQLASELGAEPGPPPAAEAATRSAATDAEAPSVAVVPDQTRAAAAGRAETVPPAAAPKAAPAEPEPAHAVPSRWRDHTVKKGETLAQVLKAFGVDKDDRAKVIAAAKGTAALTKLKTGQKLRAGSTTTAACSSCSSSWTRRPASTSSCTTTATRSTRSTGPSRSASPRPRQ